MTDKIGENEIQQLMAEWAAAVAAKNVDAILANYDADVIVFDVPPPMAVAGREAYRQNLRHWLDRFADRVAVEFKDTKITAGDDVAFVSTLTRVRNPDDANSGTWVRVTIGYKKTAGKWIVTHEHVSIPAGKQE